MSFQILGTGSFAPEKIVTNDDLSHMVETSDEWITKRVGVKQRHVCTTETATDMGVAAARRALENSGVMPEELDMIIAATISADTISPGLAGMVQNRIGAHCPCFDINVACPGFLYALDVADGFFVRGRVKKVLVVSAERMSGLIDWTDRSVPHSAGDRRRCAEQADRLDGPEYLRPLWRRRRGRGAGRGGRVPFLSAHHKGRRGCDLHPH